MQLFSTFWLKIGHKKLIKDITHMPSIEILQIINHFQKKIKIVVTRKKISQHMGA